MVVISIPLSSDNNESNNNVVTVWKGLLTVQQQRELPPESAALLGFAELYSEFQLIDYLSDLPNFTEWTSGSLSQLFTATAGNCCPGKSCRNSASTLLPGIRNGRREKMKIVELLSAEETDVSFRKWWRPKLEFKKCDYWSCIQSFRHLWFLFPQHKLNCVFTSATILTKVLQR